MRNFSKLLLRLVGIGMLLIGIGSFLMASRYSAAQEREFRELLLSKVPEMNVRDAVALMDNFRSANDTILWILVFTSLAWVCLLGMLAYAMERRAKEGQPRVPSDSQP
jgi:hypothetical protein